MKTKWIACLLLCAMVAAFLLGAKGIVNLHDSETSELESGSQDMLVGYLLVPSTDDGSFGDEAMNLTERITGEDAEPFADFCEKTGALRFLYLYINYDNNEEGRGYYKSVVDPVFTDIKTSVAAGDADNGVSFAGTMLLTPAVDLNYSWFRVYEKPDGSFYTSSTIGIWFGGSGSMTNTERAESTRTINGVETTYYTELVLTLEGVNLPTGYVILSFDADHELLERIEYTSDELPESLKLPDGTAYVLVERQEISEDGPTVNRSLYQSTDDGFHLYFDRGDGICESSYCELIWPEASNAWD